MTTATTTIVAMIPMLVPSFIFARAVPTGVGFNPNPMTQRWGSRGR